MKHQFGFLVRPRKFEKSTDSTNIVADYGWYFTLLNSHSSLKNRIVCWFRFGCIILLFIRESSFCSRPTIIIHATREEKLFMNPLHLESSSLLLLLHVDHMYMCQQVFKRPFRVISALLTSLCH
ncbi:uncharacterized protein H6S33_006486 [Morchella sextelata]|uniref:uncharacterized protein n=1 Tax=Morchella sextelata TaxID=1174677 RepID=UPI001D04130B|nr:uncharacterized protein H6S33_006486 [Morchella sextelata]KAH0604818.1 hypothetical protein H6S33_006486 [Morchella sextelata]